MNTNHPRHPYTPFALAACEKALLTLLTKIGAWGNQLVLIGGMTPRYLIGEPLPKSESTWVQLISMSSSE